MDEIDFCFHKLARIWNITLSAVSRCVPRITAVRYFSLVSMVVLIYKTRTTDIEFDVLRSIGILYMWTLLQINNYLQKSICRTGLWVMKKMCLLHTYIHTYIQNCPCIYLSMYLYIYACVYVCVYLCLYLCMCM